MAQPTQDVFPKGFIATADVNGGKGMRIDYYNEEGSGDQKSTRAQLIRLIGWGFEVEGLKVGGEVTESCERVADT